MTLRAVADLVDDYCCLVEHVLSNPERDYFPVDSHGDSHSPIIADLARSAERGEFASLAAITDMVAWVCFRDSQGRALPDEVRAAAWRLSDAIHGMRVQYQPRFISRENH
ncbi:MAG: hypothetical protein ABI665_13980 [Vicinamibacterales bacterium]